jgi:hypothetical protein
LLSGTLVLADFIEARLDPASLQRSPPWSPGRQGHRRAADWAGRLARCRALLASDDEAKQYRRSIEVLGGANSPTELARSRGLRGWLRRQRRRSPRQLAPPPTRSPAWAPGLREQAGPSKDRRLAPEPTPETSLATAQETRCHGRQGDTNREAAKLFISPATMSTTCGTSTRSSVVIADSARAEISGQRNAVFRDLAAPALLVATMPHR